MQFTRKAVVQAQDTFLPKVNLAEIDAELREQRVPGELVVSYPGNGGRSSVIFKSKPQVYRGAIENIEDSIDETNKQ